MRFDPYLYETLSFIQAHQLSKDGSLLPTTFFISFSILQDYAVGTDNERNIAFFYLEGTISSLTHDTVQIIVTSPCKQRYSAYTFLLSDIIAVRNVALEMYPGAYLNHLTSLTQSYTMELAHTELLMAFQQLLTHYHLANDKLITLIYGGIPSLKYPPTSFELIGTLLVVNQTTIIPISHVQGFFIQSICPLKSCRIPREGECI